MTTLPPTLSNDARPGALSRLHGSPWWMLAVFCALYMLSIIDRQIVNMAAPRIKSDLGLTDIELSLLLGPAFIVLYVLGGFVFGLAADRFSGQKTIFAGVLVWTLSAMGSGLSKSFAPLLVTRMGVGAGEAALAPVAYSSLRRCIPPRRFTLATSLFASAGAIGGALSLVLGGILLTMGAAREGAPLPLLGTMLDWQFAFFFAALPGLVLVLLVFTYREPPRAMQRTTAGWSEAFRYVWEQRRLTLPVFAGFAMAGTLAFGVAAWLPSLMSRKFGMTPSEIGFLLGGVSAIGGFVSHVAIGLIVDSRFAKGVHDIHLKVFIVGACLAAPLVFFALQSDDRRIFIVGVALILLCISPFLGYASALIQMISPDRLRGRMSALFIMVISGVGHGLGPTTVALISASEVAGHRLDLSLAIFVVGTSALASLLLFSGARPLRQFFREARP